MAQTINMEKKKILAIIPARGGSKGIPKKNIRFLDGKPLILHTIEAALKSKYLDKIVVSTDDQEIAKISKSAGVEIVKRPKKFSKDDSSTHSVVEHTIDYLEKIEKYRPDVVILLQPTSPLRTAKDIDSALELFLKNAPESVVAVCQSEHSIHWSFKLSGDYLEPIFGREYFNIRSQHLPKAYVSNGAIFISTPTNLFKYESFFCKKILPYIMLPEKSIDIDNENDFKLTELLIKKIK